MASGIGLRTIWVALRAVNYSRPAFQQASSSVKNLQAWQERLMKHQRQMERQSRMLIGVGLMYVAMGSMAAFAMAKLISASDEGSQYFSKFSQTASKAASSVGAALLKILKPALDMVMAVLKFIAENKALAQLFAGLTVLATSFLIFHGIMKLVQGALIRSALAAMTAKTGFFTLKGGFDMANFSAMALLNTVQLLFGVFFLTFSIAQALASVLGGPLAAAVMSIIVVVAILAALLWTSASAMSVLTFGAAAFAGIGAMVALQATQPNIPSYQRGTRFAQQTTPAVIHAGEAVVPARDVGLNQPSVTNIHTTIDLSGSTIQTKASREELLPMIKRELRNAVRSKE